MNKISTFLGYEALFNEVTYKGLVLPLSCLNGDVVDFIKDIIKEFDPHSAIGYSSFLNMVYQTQNVSRVEELTSEVINYLNITFDTKKQGILFHRLNLLNLIALIVLDDTHGVIAVTGNGNETGAVKYFKVLALINNQINSLAKNKLDDLLISYMLREYPYCYAPNLTSNYYQRWLKRYWYIYSKLLPKLITTRKDKLCRAINSLESDYGICLKDYFYILANLFNWFIYTPLHNAEGQVKGFDIKNTGTFYISSDRFSSDAKIITLLNTISLDLDGMSSYIMEAIEQDKLLKRQPDPFYQALLKFFTRPVFKFNEKSFCILDFKFFIEGITSGLFWQLQRFNSTGIGPLKEQYGYLVEEYFNELIKNIFNIEDVSSYNSKPDAVIQFEDCMVIMEFTVEYYRISSLYSSDLTEFREDIHRILFNTGIDDANSRGKKMQGKFCVLNKYAQECLDKNPNFKIIPILITEKLCGDYDLLTSLSNNPMNKLQEQNLDCLMKFKPLMLCLDDLELFWAKSGEDKQSNIKKFISCIRAWESSQKGKHHFNFSQFLCKYLDGEDKYNSDYLKFFEFKNLLNELGEVKNPNEG